MNPALKYALRDLDTLDKAVSYAAGRDAVVQAGACLGTWPAHLAKTFLAVYTFEPAPDLFVQTTAETARYSNVIRFQAALGYDRGLVGTARGRRDGKPSNHEGTTHVSGPGLIPVLRVDDLELPVLNLLVLDLEGWEPYALWGAAQTISRCRPAIMVEINQHVRAEGFSEEDVRDILRGHGYGRAFVNRSDEVWCPNF